LVEEKKFFASLIKMSLVLWRASSFASKNHSPDNSERGMWDPRTLDHLTIVDASLSDQSQLRESKRRPILLTEK